MPNENLAYIYAFSSVLSFSGASIGFTYFSHKVSVLWMNVFKCAVSFTIAVPVLYFLKGSLAFDVQSSWPFLLSGFIGLNVADWFVLSAFKKIGPARTLVLFGFQPFFVGGFSYFVWNEVVYPIQLVAILFFVLCLVLFSVERFKKTKSWEFEGLILALVGVFLDSSGVLLTRHGYNMNPDLTGLSVHCLRSLAALVSFLIYVPFVKINLLEGFKKLNPQQRSLAFLSSFFGTFLSLVFYMQAVKIGKLATVTSIILTDPAISTLFESLWLRVWPSRYLWLALLCFLCAMFFLFYPQIF